ncbi:hypothetical protein BKM32_01655 [Mangrovimonas sp. DI 80]|nr:hypothetical protein BKM32_01655 [Mangrovimonas sp. DI 80]
MDKPKILYISSVLPDTSCGARIAIYRHFVLRDDFHIAIASYDLKNEHIKDQFSIKRRKLGEILYKTRFARYYYNFIFISNWYLMPKGLVNYVKAFDPDVIMTVPDNLHSGFALQLAELLNKPLVADYQDLFPLSLFFPQYCKPYNWVRKFLMKKYHKLNASADKVLYTSEGMFDFFGRSRNGKVLYPIGHAIPKIESALETNDNGKFTILYAGNCYGSYGEMLLRLAKEIMQSENLHLKIFPAGNDWSKDDISLMANAGIYQSFLPFEELKKELQKADAFLTVMSFKEVEKPFVQTSFTTKWLDYAPYGKPIFVWAPKYSSASIFAEKHRCGFVCDINDAKLVMGSFQKALKDRSLARLFGENAQKVSDTILNAENIHSILKDTIKELTA